MGFFISWYLLAYSYPNTYKKKRLIGPVGSNHGSLARARARGAGSPWTAQSLLLALGRLPDPDDNGHGVGRGGEGQGRRPASEATRKAGASGMRMRIPTKLLSRS